MNSSKLCLAFALALTTATAAHAQDAHWVGTWSTAPMQTTATGATVVLGAPPAPAPARPAVQPPATPPPTPPRSVPDAVNGAGQPLQRPASPPPLGSTDVTLMQTVHLSLGGSAVRVVFTNEYGTEPLTIGEATVVLVTRIPQLASSPSSSAPGVHSLQFGGKPGIVVPPGAIAITDPVPMNVPAFADLQINLFIPAQTISHITRHTGALQTSYIQAGNFAVPKDDAAASVVAPIYSWTFLKSVDVLAPADAGAVVAFGDSITDGAYATRDQNARWPDDLARRLAANPKTAHLAVLNEGIGGNRVLHDNTGPSALARFTRDALDQAGVKYIIFLEAINDIGNAYRTTPAPHDVVSAEDLIQGYEQMIVRAHLKGIKVIGATLTPYGGASYMSPEGDKVRNAVNTWIRTTKDLDGVIDFDKATLDPAHPDAFLPAYDHGDHLHPTDAGLKAMADAIDLSLFTK